MTGERVLVVPRACVPDEGSWLGLRTAGLDAFLAVAQSEGRFRERSRMEHDRSFKQLIPYLVLRDGPRYFLMQRTRAGADARLHDRYSIGVGGHVNPGDAGLLGGLRREWAEELDTAFEPPFEPYALINDDSTDVGSVHLGIVFLADAQGRSVAVREQDKLRGAFASAEEVAVVADRLESWSLLIFEALSGMAVRSGISES